MTPAESIISIAFHADRRCDPRPLHTNMRERVDGGLDSWQGVSQFSIGARGATPDDAVMSGIRILERNMMSTKRLLLAGETFTLVQAAVSGLSVGRSSRYVNGATHFLAAMRGTNFAIEQLPSERCEADFPRTLEELQDYSAVILSDVGALTLLFTPESRQGHVSVNRLDLLRDYVRAGGSLMMAGGYTSYQGMDGQARYHETAVEDCLPVTCLPHSDGLEAPQGLFPTVAASHSIVAAAPAEWPPILGLNEVIAGTTPDTTLVADVNYRGRRLPVLAVREFGAGRTLAFMTDIGPHWMSQRFLASSWYGDLMRGMMRWLCRES